MNSYVPFIERDAKEARGSFEDTLASIDRTEKLALEAFERVKTVHQRLFGLPSRPYSKRIFDDLKEAQGQAWTEVAPELGKINSYTLYDGLDLFFAAARLAGKGPNAQESRNEASWQTVRGLGGDLATIRRWLEEAIDVKRENFAGFLKSWIGFLEGSPIDQLGVVADLKAAGLKGDAKRFVKAIERLQSLRTMAAKIKDKWTRAGSIPLMAAEPNVQPILDGYVATIKEIFQ